MNDLKIFSSEKFGTVRTVIKGNEPWFVAAPVFHGPLDFLLRYADC